MAPAVAETAPQDEPGARDKLLHRMVRQVCFLQAAEGRRSARRPVASWVEAGRRHAPLSQRAFRTFTISTEEHPRFRKPLLYPAELRGRGQTTSKMALSC